MKQKRFICFVLAAILLVSALMFVSCSSDTMPMASSAAGSEPTWHITVYSPEIRAGTYAAHRDPKYTVTTDDLSTIFQWPYKEYGMLTISSADGRVELVSASLVEIEYY